MPTKKKVIDAIMSVKNGSKGRKVYYNYNTNYWQTYQPEHTVTYYKKQLQHLRGQKLRQGRNVYQQALGAAKDVKEKFALSDYTEKQYRNMLGVMDIDYREKNRRLAAYYEREYKILSGQYETERLQAYLDRIENYLDLENELPTDVYRLWKELCTPDIYYVFADKLGEGDLIFADSDDRTDTSTPDGVIIERVKDAIIEAARNHGYKATNMKELLMEYYDYDEEEAIEILS